jgi:hypothetical protein
MDLRCSAKTSFDSRFTGMVRFDILVAYVGVTGNFAWPGRIGPSGLAENQPCSSNKMISKRL